MIWLMPLHLDGPRFFVLLILVESEPEYDPFFVYVTARAESFTCYGTHGIFISYDWT